MGWKDIDFVRHFYLGEGKSVTLREIGLIDEVKSHAELKAIKKFRKQIEEKGKNSISNNFKATFHRSYDFRPVVYSLGGCNLKGSFRGGVCPYIGSSPKMFWIEGVIRIRFKDTFTDPLSVIEKLYGSSDSPKAPTWLKELMDIGGKRYLVRDSWQKKYKNEKVI